MVPVPPRTHGGILNSPDLTTYLAIHAALRSGAHRLANGAGTLEATDRRRLGAFRTYFNGYAGEVLAHHTIEDDYFFPTLTEQVGATTARIERLDRDHADLDEMMTAVTDGLGRIGAGTLTGAEVAVSLRELAVHMDEHLDFEDEEILPLFARHFSVSSTKRSKRRHRRASASGSRRHSRSRSSPRRCRHTCGNSCSVAHPRPCASSTG